MGRGGAGRHLLNPHVIDVQIVVSAGSRGLSIKGNADSLSGIVCQRNLHFFPIVGNLVVHILGPGSVAPHGDSLPSLPVVDGKQHHEPVILLRGGVLYRGVDPEIRQGQSERQRRI